MEKVRAWLKENRGPIFVIIMVVFLFVSAIYLAIQDSNQNKIKYEQQIQEREKWINKSVIDATWTLISITIDPGTFHYPTAYQLIFENDENRVRFRFGILPPVVIGDKVKFIPARDENNHLLRAYYSDEPIVYELTLQNKNSISSTGYFSQ